MNDREETMDTSHKFKPNQICEGEGMKFQVVSLDPLTVLCLEVEGQWKSYAAWQDHKTWIPGRTYELKMGNPDIRNFNFLPPDLPWCSVYESGDIRHYR